MKSKSTYRPLSGVIGMVAKSFRRSRPFDAYFRFMDGWGKGKRWHHKDQWLADIVAVANAMHRRRKSFDRDRFYAACGVKVDEDGKLS